MSNALSLLSVGRVHLQTSSGDAVSGSIRLDKVEENNREYHLDIPELNAKEAAGCLVLKTHHPKQSGEELASPFKVAPRLFNVEQWLHVDWINNRTKNLSLLTGKEMFQVTVPKIGSALMEHAVARAFSWDSHYCGRIFLRSSSSQLFTYWHWHFRPHPDWDRELVQNVLKMHEREKSDNPISNSERPFYDSTMAVIAKSRSCKVSEITPELLSTVTTTEVMQQIFNDAVDKTAIHAGYLGDQCMYLPPEGQQMWKERILTAPKVAHEPRFLNQLRLEILWPEAGEKAPKPVRDLVLDYCAEEMP